jgi:tryptophan synthase beta chain
MKELDSSSNVVINVSGRGDKDINTVAEIDGIEF